MIEVIYGKKGSGKTKRLIDLANASIQETKGDVLFIDDDKRYMFDLRHEIRFVNAGEYGIHNPDAFYGFVCGLLAQNFDVSIVFVDAFLKLTRGKLDEMDGLFRSLEALAKAHNVKFVLSISGDEACTPEYMAPYLIA